MIYLLVVFLSSFFCTYLVIIFAKRKKIIDIPNDRSSHTIPTPRGGGLAIAIVWFVSLFYMYFYKIIDKQFFYALLPGILISVIGIIDDVYNLKSSVRLLIQALSAAISLYFLNGLSHIDFGFFTFNGIWILSPLAFITIIWFVNLFNFLDGIDGYLSSEIIFISFAAYFFVSNNVFLILSFSVLGFLVWNWQKAKIFMGDVGSTLLGFNVAIFAIYFQNNKQSSLLMWLMLSSVFWFDATLTLWRRFRNHEKLSTPHRKHAYQRIVQSGFSHQKTVLLAAVINIIIFIFAYFAFKQFELLLPFLLIIILLLYLVVKIIDKRKPFENKIN